MPLTGLMLAENIAGRILPFDSAAAGAYAPIAAARCLARCLISQADARIAAIAESRAAAIATRNVADFDGCGISVLDPWAA